MKIGTTVVDDTFAEAFPMKFTRLIVTAHDVIGFVRPYGNVAATPRRSLLAMRRSEWSVVVEKETPDQRSGVALLFSESRVRRSPKRHRIVLDSA